MILGELIEQDSEIVFETVLDMRVKSKKDGKTHIIILPTFMVPFYLLGGRVVSYSCSGNTYYRLNMEVRDIDQMINGAKVWEEIYNRV